MTLDYGWPSASDPEQVERDEQFAAAVEARRALPAWRRGAGELAFLIGGVLVGLLLIVLGVGLIGFGLFEAGQPAPVGAPGETNLSWVPVLLPIGAGGVLAWCGWAVLSSD